MYLKRQLTLLQNVLIFNQQETHFQNECNLNKAQKIL